MLPADAPRVGPAAVAVGRAMAEARGGWGGGEEWGLGVGRGGRGGVVGGMRTESSRGGGSMCARCGWWGVDEVLSFGGGWGDLPAFLPLRKRI